MPDEPPGEPPPGRKRAYFWLMGTCLVLIVLAWNVVRLLVDDGCRADERGRRA